jgi:hypothetical protein
MSNNRNVNWEIDDEDEDDDFIPQQGLDDSRLVRDFRKQLKAEQRKNKELQESIASLQKTQKERIIKDVFTSKGVNAKIAAFVPADLEASEEAITNWIDTYADVFGIQTQAQEPAVNQQDIANLQRMNNATTNVGTPSFEETLASQLSGANSEEELMSILNGGQ